MDRFPGDFLIQLTREELKVLRCQFGTLEQGQYSKYLPYAFTEQGVAMLSSVLKSKRAVQVNIQIMRVFTKLREMMITHKELASKLAEVEGKVNKHDKEIQLVFDAIRRLMSKPAKEDDVYKRTKIGFVTQEAAKRLI
jgi:hypothetical protein